ncbi:glycosyltransferase family 2 protein [Maricaulis maris]|uniref:glycosyltransferase family 2 protein n=1 Tax=Maricaulis maris TaxID=74318 RepID=UPI0011C3E9E3|nr:glycosyltransferase family 2 protein [Maricaulis maris]
MRPENLVTVLTLAGSPVLQAVTRRDMRPNIARGSVATKSESFEEIDLSQRPTRLAAPHVQAHEAPAYRAEIAVIVPFYKGEAFVDEMCQRLHATLGAITDEYEIILVDDRSPDGSWPLITAQAYRDARVSGVRLSRNFGQHAAISAGMAHANARWYVVMDCDLQDPPEAIAELHSAALEGDDDIVIAERISSGLGAGRNLGSALFNGVLRWASGLEVSAKVGNFRIFSDRVAHAYREYPEQLRLFPAIMSQLGFSKAFVKIARDERAVGQSSYNFIKLARLGIETIVAYSEKPLWLAAGIGSAVSAMAVLFGVYTFFSAVILGTEVPGYASLAILMTFLGGVQIFLISFVGLYVGQALAETKDRPIFIVDKIVCSEYGIR